MKRHKLYMNAKQVLNELSARTREELDWLMKTISCPSYLPSEVKELLLRHIGVKVTIQCANELQQHYRKLKKEPANG